MKVHFWDNYELRTQLKIILAAFLLQNVFGKFFGYFENFKYLSNIYTSMTPKSCFL